MSGKSGEDQMAKDSALVKSAQEKTKPSFADTVALAMGKGKGKDQDKDQDKEQGAGKVKSKSGDLPALPTASKSSLLAVGFKTTKGKDAFDSDTDDDNVSEMSFDERPPGPSKALPSLSGMPAESGANKPAAPVVIPPPPQPVAQPMTMGNGQRRGSLLDATGAAANLLNLAKAKVDASDSDGGDDWDE